MLKKLINSFSLIFETANKERKLIFKDDATVEIYIFFVALVYFFYSFVYSPEIFTKLPIAYVDNDQTTVSHQIKNMLNDTESMSIAYEASSMAEARKLFEEGKVNGIVIIPEKFSEKLQKSGGNPSIAIYCDASYMLYYDKSLQAVTNALGAFTGEIQLKQTMMSGVPMKEAVASSKPFNIIANPLYNLEEGYGIFIIPMVLIVALQTLQLTGMGVLYGTLRERNTFTTHFAMAKRSKFGYFFMTIGRSIPYLVISMLLLLLGILVVFHIFTIPQRGNLFEVIVFLVPVILAITFLGMTLMNIFRNREDTIMLLTVFSIPALMMGGVSYPVIAFPLWIEIMAFFFPSTIGVKGFLALSQAGASLSEINDIYIQMWILCLFYFVLAVWTNRKFLKRDTPTNQLALTTTIADPIAETKIDSDHISTTNSIPSAIIPSSVTPSDIIPSENIQAPIVSENKELPGIDIKGLLNPIKSLFKDYDFIIDNIEGKLLDKLKSKTNNELQTPPAYIAVPIFESLRITLDNPDYLNSYCNLLANAMDPRTAGLVHPRFINTLRQITPDEIKLLSIFGKEHQIPFLQLYESNSMTNQITSHNHILEDTTINLSYPDNLALYLDNLIKLDIINAHQSTYNSEFETLVNCQFIKDLKKKVKDNGGILDLDYMHYKSPIFGTVLIEAAIKNKV